MYQISGGSRNSTRIKQHNSHVRGKPTGRQEYGFLKLPFKSFSYAMICPRKINFFVIILDLCVNKYFFGENNFL